MKKLLLAAIVSLLAILALPAASWAGTGSLKGSSVNNGHSIGNCSGCSGSGGGGGGSASYWELRNTDHKVNWNRVHLIHPTNEEQASRINATTLAPKIVDLVETPCRNHPNSEYCPVWYDDPQTDSRWQKDVHTPSYSTGAGAPNGTSAGTVVAYNIKIWREGDDYPIFERRVGINGDKDGQCRSDAANEDTDPYGAPNAGTWWWNGGGDNGDRCVGLFTQSGSTGGPVSSITSNQWNRCIARVRDARNRSLGKNKSIPTARLLNSERTCYYEGNDFGRGSGSRNSDGSYEAVTLHWDFANYNPRAGHGNIASGPTFYAEVVKRPDTYYLVQTVALDAREQIIGQGRCLGADNIYSDITLATTINENDNCFTLYAPDWTCEPNCDEPEETPPQPREVKGDLDVELQNTPVAVTRTPLDFSISTYSKYADQPLYKGLQAIFPRMVRLNHFTPQLDYNGAHKANSYDRDYVLYGPNGEWSNSAGSLRFSQANGALGPKGEMLNMGRYPQAPHLPITPGNDTDMSVTRNDYVTRYLRPTLNNPCNISTNDPASPGQGDRVWPVESTQCAPSRSGRDLGNAWDDSYSATVTYESRWGRAMYNVRNGTPMSRNKDVGVVPRGSLSQHLRCDGGNDNPIDADNCPDTRHQLEALADTAPQYAQGYFVAEGEPRSGSRRPTKAAINVRLETNRPDLVYGWNLLSREGADNNTHIPDGATEGYYNKNTISGQPEMWFCDQGYNVGNGPGDRTRYNGNNQLVPLDEARTVLKDSGRMNCNGWAADWSWDAWNPYVFDWGNPSQNTCKIFPQGGFPAGLPANHGEAPPYNSPGYALTDWPEGYNGYFGGGRWPYPNDISKIPFGGKKPGMRPGYPNADADPIFGNVQGCYALYPNAHHAVAQVGWDTHTIDLGPESPCRTEVNPETGVCDYHDYYSWQDNPRVVGWTGCDYWRGPYDHGVQDLGAGHLDRYGNAAAVAATTPSPTCAYPFFGHVKTGKWVVDNRHPAGKGWGVNNTGPKMDPDGYLASFVFASMPNSVAPSVWWDMHATYEGDRNLTWRSENKRFVGEETIQRVYAPRDAR